MHYSEGNMIDNLKFVCVLRRHKIVLKFRVVLKRPPVRLDNTADQFLFELVLEKQHFHLNSFFFPFFFVPIVNSFIFSIFITHCDFRFS